MAADLEI